MKPQIISTASQLAENPQKIPKELVYEILINLPVDELLALCADNQLPENICNSVVFWAQKLRVPIEEFKMTNLTPIQRFLQLYGGCTYGSENFKPVTQCAELAGRQGNVNLINYFISKGYNETAILEAAAIGASKSGRVQLLNYLINKGAKRLSLFGEYAARYGHLDIVQYLYEKIRESRSSFIITRFISSVLLGAARGNDLDIIEYILNREYPSNILNNLPALISTTPLTTAAEYGSLEIFKYLYDVVREGYIQPNLDLLLGYAVRGANLPLIEYLISLGARNFTDALTEVVDLDTKTAVHIINYLYQKSREFNVHIDLQYIIELFAVYERLDLVKYILTLGNVDINGVIEILDRTLRDEEAGLEELNVNEELYRENSPNIISTIEKLREIRKYLVSIRR